jgi:hypothetical protein
MKEPAALFVAAFATAAGDGANMSGRTGSEEEMLTGLAWTEKSLGEEDADAAATSLSPDCRETLSADGRGQNTTIPSTTAAASSIHLSRGNMS